MFATLLASIASIWTAFHSQSSAFHYKFFQNWFPGTCCFPKTGSLYPIALGAILDSLVDELPAVIFAMEWQRRVSSAHTLFSSSALVLSTSSWEPPSAWSAPHYLSLIHISEPTRPP